MSTTMRVRKGDLVQILSGKDRGKQGRVIEARPRERRVVVENLNVVKRHTRPKPVKDSSRMGGPSIIPGGVIDKPAPLAASKVMVVCPVCNRPTRVGSLHVGHTTITFETSIGAGFSMMPPGWICGPPMRLESLIGRGRVCRLTIFRFSTTTRRSDGRASMTRPCLPRSFPLRI